MVDLIPIKKLYQYVSLQRQDLPEGRRYIYGEQKLPSVTTILSATKKDKGALDAWVARVGQEEADRIKNEARRHLSARGYRAHGGLSTFTTTDELGNV